MNPAEETAYCQGSHMAWVMMLQQCLKGLGHGDPAHDAAAWALEREEAMHQLRSLCAEVGDNDWEDGLHLADVIDKHLARHLMEPTEIPANCCRITIEAPGRSTIIYDAYSMDCRSTERSRGLEDVTLRFTGHERPISASTLTPPKKEKK